MEKYHLKINSLRYHLNFFWTNFIINWKSVVEYKSNLYSVLILQLTIMPIFLLFGFLLNSLVLGDSNWTTVEFILFILLTELYVDIIGIFYFGKNLNYQIKEGDLNPLLTKPSSVFLSVYSIQRFNTLLFIIINSISYSILLILFNFQTDLINIVFGFFLFLIICVVGLLFTYFHNSINWLILESGIFFNRLDWEVQYGVLARYPAFFFEKSPLILIFASIFPIYYLSMWIVPLISFGTFTPTLTEILIFGLIAIISLIGIMLNWKYGLKNYEAYG